jgi:glucose uptake protein
VIGWLYALVTVLAWGSWLAPSQAVTFPNQQIKTFYVAAANLVLAGLVLALQGAAGLTWAVFWPPFVGGLVWSVSGYLAFTATGLLGMARAYGIWAPINVGVSMLWGAIIFNEFLSASPLTLGLLALALAIILSGVLLIIFAKGRGAQRLAPRIFWSGLLAALGAGVLWGSYYIPIKLSAASMWTASFPLALGIFAGSALLAGVTRQPLRLQRAGSYLRAGATGLLWGIGNYGMLLLVEQMGAGRGFTLSQLGVVVNGLIGIYILKDPQPRSRAALLTLIGCVLATAGGILLGNLK